MAKNHEIFTSLCRHLRFSQDYTGTQTDFETTCNQLGLSRLPRAFENYWNADVVYGPPGFVMFRPAKDVDELVALNLQMRNQEGLRHELIVFAKSGDDAWWLMDLSSNPNGPVYSCDAAFPVNIDSESPYANSFNEFLVKYGHYLVRSGMESLAWFQSQLELAGKSQ